MSLPNNNMENIKIGDLVEYESKKYGKRVGIVVVQKNSISTRWFYAEKKWKPCVKHSMRIMIPLQYDWLDHCTTTRGVMIIKFEQLKLSDWNSLRPDEKKVLEPYRL